MRDPVAPILHNVKAIEIACILPRILLILVHLSQICPQRVLAVFCAKNVSYFININGKNIIYHHYNNHHNNHAVSSLHGSLRCQKKAVTHCHPLVSIVVIQAVW